MSLEDGKTCLAFIEDWGIYNPSSKGQDRGGHDGLNFMVLQNPARGEKNSFYGFMASRWISTMFGWEVQTDQVVRMSLEGAGFCLDKFSFIIIIIIYL